MCVALPAAPERSITTSPKPPELYKMFRRAPGCERRGDAHHGERLDIDAARRNIRGKKGALLEGDPCGPIAAELGFEHESERRCQMGSRLLTGQFHQAASQIAQLPRWKIGKNRGDRRFHSPIIANIKRKSMACTDTFFRESGLRF